ncbi:methionyl-tRNA formyltransferase [Myxosarcina sp. GI1]|uniref:methionyl-tRNA formyltransferase n=1 Tax=Myxosarcina sp. GI1 TaxID=1541065 RepID=UPI00056A22E8|nr:methionyl-tRNA formyltransferase [Myxosarcina sp. GI1]
MQLVFFGTPQFAVPTLEKLLQQQELEVVGVVTQPDKRRGRGNKTLPSAVKKVAIEHNLTVWQPPNIKKHRATLDKLEAIAADVFVVVAYGQILSPEILQMPRLGCINVHGSLLPQYRGAAPIQWSIVRGETKTGVTTMLMDRGMDTGDMLLKAETAIDILDDAESIATKLSQQGADLLIETLFKLEGQKIKPVPQDDSLATYAPLIKKTDLAIDWSQTAIDLHNKIRGFYPNCIATYENQRLKLLTTVPLIEPYLKQLPEHYDIIKQQWADLELLTGVPGEIVRNIKNLGPIVQTGSGLLLLERVQPAGKRQQSGWDFVNGMRLSIGTQLGNG